MNSRLVSFLAAENITQSQFADTIGVARAGVSHIIAGRNKPGFDFIENMARHYPSLNLEWLITGKGKMYKEAQLAPDEHSSEEELFAEERTTWTPKKTISRDNELKPAENQKLITRIVVFYSDNTFEEFNKI